MELMNRVRAILDERNISQASFARKIDVSPQVLSGWMMGRRTPGIAELAAMAEELHVSPSYLLTGRDDDPNRQSLVDDDGVCIPLLRSCVVRKRRAACYHNRSQDDQGQSPVDQPVLRHSQSERTGFFCPFTTFTGFPYKRTVYIPALIAYTFR